jgi:hypothetical protein
LKPSTGELSAIIGMLSAINRNQCPQSIGTPVRNPRNPHSAHVARKTALDRSAYVADIAAAAFQISHPRGLECALRDAVLRC